MVAEEDRVVPWAVSGPLAWRPRKSAEGQREMRERTRRLAPRLRTVLLLIDGLRTVDDIRRMALAVGAPPTCLDELVALGLVEPPPTLAPATQTPPPVVRVEAEPVAAAPALTVPIAPAVADAVPSAIAEPALPVRVEPVADDDVEPAETLAAEAMASEPPVSADPAQDIAAPAATEAAVASIAETSAPPSQPESHRGPWGPEGTLPEPPPRKAAGRWLDSVKGALMPIYESAFGVVELAPEEAPADSGFEEARRILMRAVREKAPIAGAFTLRRLRRASNRTELLALFDEVGERISQPLRTLSAQQVLSSAREVLDREPPLA